MTLKLYYLKDAIVNGAMSLQDGGTIPNGLSGTGWTVAKLASPNFSLMAAGTEKSAFVTSDPMATASFSAASCWRTENPISGTFSGTGNWLLGVRIRAASAASSQTGAIKFRVWKSTAADGTGATQLTSSLLTGNTTTALSTTTSNSSVVTWSPGAITLSNEYLWVQTEWSIVTASGSNNGDALVMCESACNIGPTDFSQSYSDTITSSSIPINGATITPVYHISYVETITASSIPIDGATIIPVYTVHYGDTITPSSIPIDGSAMTPIYSTGSVGYSDSITASSIPIDGQTINDVYAVHSYADTIVAGSIPISGRAISPIFHHVSVGGSGAVSVNVGGVWMPAITHVKTGGVWEVATTHVKSGGVWEQL